MALGALKKSFKNRLIRWGIELRKLTLFERLLLERLNASNPFEFVQIGANDGVSFDTLFWQVTRQKSRGLVVEPLADMFERLSFNYRAYPKITPVQVAVHPTLSEVVLHRPNPERLKELPAWIGGTASVHPDWHQEYGIAPSEIVEERVPAMHLMALLDQYKFPRLDLLQVDVEGFDAEVIKMIDFSRIKPELIKYESVRRGMNESADDLLRTNGYQVQRDGIDMVAWLAK